MIDLFSPINIFLKDQGVQGVQGFQGFQGFKGDLLLSTINIFSRLLIGIVLGFVVGCADMYFVIRQLLEEDGIKLKKIE